MADIFDDDILGEGSVNADLGGMKVRTSLYYLPVIFIVDCSRSMDEEGRIESVNSALKDLKYRLTEIKNNNSLDMRVAVMSFTSSVKWELELTPIDEVVFDTIKTRPGNTRYGVVFSELNRVLTNDEFMKHTGKCAPPAIMFLTDGEPSDDYSYKLDVLLENGYFTGASRSVVLIGEAVDSDRARAALGRFVEEPVNDIVSVDDSTQIIQKINTATMHTILGTPSGNADPDNTKKDLSSDNDTADDPDLNKDNDSGSDQKDGTDQDDFPDDTTDDSADDFPDDNTDDSADDFPDDIPDSSTDDTAGDPYGDNPFDDPF